MPDESCTDGYTTEGYANGALSSDEYIDGFTTTQDSEDKASDYYSESRTRETTISAGHSSADYKPLITMQQTSDRAIVIPSPPRKKKRKRTCNERGVF